MKFTQNDHALSEFNPNHQPAGSPEGGEFARAGAGEGGGPKKPTLTWKVRKTTVQAGEYKEANREVPEQFTPDGRFSIHRTGAMAYKHAHGFHGNMTMQWRWRGYLLTDNHPNLPKWITRTARFTSVAGAKREAENRARKYPA